MRSALQLSYRFLGDSRFVLAGRSSWSDRAFTTIFRIVLMPFDQAYNASRFACDLWLTSYEIALKTEDSMMNGKFTMDNNVFAVPTLSGPRRDSASTAPAIASSTADSTVGLSRLNVQGRGTPKPASPEPWEDYHFLLALMLLVGVIASNHTVAQFMAYLEHLNTLEESGLAACALVVFSRVLRVARMAMQAINIAWGH